MHRVENEVMKRPRLVMRWLASNANNRVRSSRSKIGGRIQREIDPMMSQDHLDSEMAMNQPIKSQAVDKRRTSSAFRQRASIR